MRLILAAASTSLLVLAAACGANSETSEQSAAATGAPVETRPPHGANQQPAFAGQTRAPGVRTEQAMSYTVVASGLEHPWGLAQLPDGRWSISAEGQKILSDVMRRNGQRSRAWRESSEANASAESDA